MLKTHRWVQTSFLATALLGLVLVLYSETGTYLILIWNQVQTGEYAHGYLVLAISLYLIYRKRNLLTSMQPCPGFLALPGIAASGFLWLVGSIADIQIVQAAALLLLIFSVVWSWLGWAIARHLAFPILFVFYAIPVWFPLSPYLQVITADVTFWILRLVEIPAYRQEHLIILPSGTLSIEEACSGLRYVLSALTLGTLYAYMNYQTLGERIVVVVISLAAAILANIVRVYIVLYLAFTTEMQHPWVADHLSLGWFIFAGVVFVLLMVDYKLQGQYDAEALSNEHENLPVHSACQNKTVREIIMFVLAVALISAGPIAAYQIDHRPLSNHDVTLVLPKKGDNWLSSTMVKDDWNPMYEGAISKKRLYHADTKEVSLYIGYYLEQSQGRELINDLNQIGGLAWNTVYPHAKPLSAEDPAVLEQLIERQPGKQRLVWYWYRIGNQYTTNKYMAKMLQVLELLSGREQAAIIAISTPVRDELENAREVLHAFLTVMDDPINHSIDNAQ